MKKAKTIFTAVLAVLLPMGAQADDFLGTVDTDWSNGLNWSTTPTAPGASIAVVYIKADAIYTAANGTTNITNDFNIARGGPAGSLTMTGGIITVDDAWGTIIGQQNTGVFTIDGGASFTQVNDKNVLIGNGGGTGTINLIDGTLALNTTTAGIVFGSGLLNISGGTAILGMLPTMTNGDIVFSNASTGSLSIFGADMAYYEGLYAAGDLIRTGGTGTFATDFSVAGTTITAVPEPSSAAALLGLAGLALVFRRRK